jgi:hypothetical protein
VQVRDLIRRRFPIVGAGGFVSGGGTVARAGASGHFDFNPMVKVITAVSDKPPEIGDGRATAGSRKFAERCFRAREPATLDIGGGFGAIEIFFDRHGASHAALDYFSPGYMNPSAW